MNSYAWILTLLKYSGLALATISSIWSVTNVISKEIDGKKKLTRAGKIAVLLTISGLAISITSNMLEDRLKAKKAMEAAVNEARRTNRIILAGQPLSSLSFELNYSKEETDFNESWKEADEHWQHEAESEPGEVSSSKGAAIFRGYMTFPMFGASVSAPNRKPPFFLFLVSLDADQNNIVSYGYLDTDAALYNTTGNKRERLLFRQAVPYSKGIFLDDNVAAAAYYGDDSKIREPHFLRDSSHVTLKWDLNAYTLHNCLNKINENIPLMANLPSVIKVAIIFDMEYLPFSSGNMTFSNRFLWEESDMDSPNSLETIADSIRHVYANSAISLVPNQLSDQVLHYKLRKAYKKIVLDEEWEETTICKALLLLYEKTPEE